MLKQLLIVSLLLAGGAYFLTTTPAQNRDTDRVQAESWRHLALSSVGRDDAEIARKINELGADGWEMFDVESFVSGGETAKTVYYFKKPD